MTRDELRAIGMALYGHEWQSPLARALGVSPRYIRKLVSGEAPIGASIEAEIRALTGATDPDALDRMRPRDAWIMGEGPERPDGSRIEYLLHARRPRFIARIAGAAPGMDEDADRGTGVVYGSALGDLCEIAWIDPPPGPAEMLRLMEAAIQAIEDGA